MNRCRITALLSLLLLASPRPVSAAGLVVEVQAGTHPRRDTPVSLEINGLTAPGVPPAVSARLWEVSGPVTGPVTGTEEREVPVQVEPAAPGWPPRAHWVLAGETAQGKSRRFRLELETAPHAEGAGAEGRASGPAPLAIHDEKGKHLEVRRGGRPVLRYNYGRVTPPEPGISPIQTRNAYLHPLWSPAGREVTMDYPRNHLHHRGVWFPWVNTEFEGRTPDFWNLGDGKGTVEWVETGAVFEGPVVAGFRVRHRHVDLKAAGGPRPALLEEWTLRVHQVGGGRDPYFLFDLDSRQECAGESPLILKQYRYGGLGVRGSWDWEGDAVRVFTSEGKGRLNGEGSHARWLALGGPVGGQWAGLAVLGHPANFRAPQAVRVHPTEPFVNFAPVKDGAFEIRPGQPYVSRYRFYVHDGVVRADEVERLWLDYAEPPLVRIIR